jgi:hypothetical protein
MKKRLALLLCALVLAAIACGGGGAGTVRVVAGDTTVCFVQMSPSSQSTWGGDWLGAQEVISPGHSRTFHVPTDRGPYDIRLSACPNGAHTILQRANLPVNTQAVTVTGP